MSYKKAKEMSTDDIKFTLKCLWASVERGTLSRKDPCSYLNKDTSYLIEDWEQDLVSVLESRNIPLTSI